MKQQVFYIHGGESYSKYEDYLQRLESIDIRDLPDAAPFPMWKDTFRDDLGEDFEVFMPAMPNKNNAKYEEWKIWFERHFEHFHDEVVVIGFSLGAMFLTKYFSEENPLIKVKALILLAPATYFFTDSETGEDGGDFNCDAEKLSNIISNTERLILFHSKDDFVIPYDHSEKFKELVPEAELVTFEDKNHFLVEELPELVELIKSLS